MGAKQIEGMEYYKEYICVTVDELTSQDEGLSIMSESNYRQLVARKRLNVVRRGGGLGVYTLIDYSSLPDRFKVLFVEKYGDPEELLDELRRSNEIIIDSAARKYYDAYRLSDGSALDELKQDEYTMTASILNHVIEAAATTKAVQKARGGKGISQRDRIMEKVEEYRRYPGHNLPESWVRLSAKIRKYKAQGYEALVEGYLGNRNTVKITEDMGRYIIALKRSKVRSYTNEQIFEQVNTIADEKGWKKIKSRNTLLSYLERPDVKQQWYDARLGSKAANYKYNRKHRTILPDVRDMQWCSDGTKLNLYYRDWCQSSNRWKVCTTSVYEVIDVATEMFLGYCISDRENFEAQYAAYRMAIEFAGHRPCEILYDNQGGHKKAEARELFSKISRLDRPTAPYSGNSKTIESVFGRFQEQVLSTMAFYTGQNITARSESSRIDLDWIECNVENLPTYEELKVMYIDAREQWNDKRHHAAAAKGRTRREMYLQTENPLATPITDVELIDIFWKTSDKEITFTSSGLTINVDKEKYTYDVYGADGMPDLDFRRKNTFRKYVVKYDPLDMTTVRLYTKDARGVLKFATEAQPYFEVYRATYQQSDEDRAFIRTMQERQKEYNVKHHIEMIELEMEHGVAPEQHGYNRPKVSGISKKSIERYMDKALVQGVEEVVSLGQYNKVVSNTTQDKYDKI